MQFETIHPFLDGNGRIGRLLITLVLCHDGVLREPLLYSSLYFKQHRQEYYAQLNAVRKSGDFERWLEFFATAIRVSADVATATGRRIFTVFREDRDRLKGIGRQAPTTLVIQEALQGKPLATIAALTQSTRLTTPTVTQALREPEKLGIVRGFGSLALWRWDRSRRPEAGGVADTLSPNRRAGQCGFLFRCRTSLGAPRRQLSRGRPKRAQRS